MFKDNITCVLYFVCVLGKVAWSQKNMCSGVVHVELCKGTTDYTQWVGTARMRIAHCGMQGVIHVFLTGSGKLSQLQSVMSSNWSKKALFLVI